ncbi:DNA polymerase family B-domain-containing protein [Phlyctochytrium arcticum]|nr:DNA polymerase family B-domain-containing protein [Phlyctochytrium arcticum]
MADRKALLKKLRERRATGGAAAAEDCDDEDKLVLYDELTETEYTALRRRRMLEGDDFVVDDDGMGDYVDYGQDEWASSGASDEDEEEETSKKPKDAKDKRKRKAKDGQNAKNGEDIKDAFSKQTKRSRPAVVQKTAISAEAEQDLMGSIFDDLDQELSKPILKKSKLGSTTVRKTINESYTGANRASKPSIAASSFNMSNPFIVPSNGMNGKISKSEKEPEMETLHIQANPYGFETQDHEPYLDDQNADLDVFEPIAEQIEEQPLSAIERPSLPQVKVKSLQTRQPTKVASFAPKFERQEEKLGVGPPVAFESGSSDSNARGWMAMKDTIAVQNLVSSSAPSQGTFSGTQASTNARADILEADGSLRMFWFDAMEKDGVVYLFGKVLNRRDGSYISTCAVVQNIQRNLFILPREYVLDDGGHPTDIEVEFSAVYREFDELRRKHNVKEFLSGTVSRQYAFELPGVPAESDYMKVIYPFSQPEIPAKSTGRTFSRIFGAQSSALELFILKRKLMGPCWVNIRDANFATNPISWCKVEIIINDPKTLKPFDANDDDAPKNIPPLVVMSLAIRTVMNHKKHVNEIVTASGLVYHSVPIDGGSNTEEETSKKNPPSRFTVIRPMSEVPLPAGFTEKLHSQRTKTEVTSNERGLLAFLIAQIHCSDPDVIVGHNFIDFDLDVLLHRMQANKVDFWSKIGRLRRTKWPRLQHGAGGTSDSTYAERQIASGRLLCDTYKASRDLIRSKSYSLTQLATSQLNVDRPAIDYEQLPNYFWDSNKLLHMLQHCEFDAYLQAELMTKLQILPLTKQLTNLAGNLWSRTLTGARAERNEYLLLHEFHEKKFVVPDRATAFGAGKAKKAVAENIEAEGEEENHVTPGTSSRKKPAYSGGLVLEPKKGFYDKFVLMLDFNSLYPSIIQEYNICFTTIERSRETPTEALTEEQQMPDVADPDLPKGILPRLLATLVGRRQMVKTLMKGNDVSPALMAQYDIRQKALKLTANSMYGCLGFTHSRFYAKPLAMLITSKGREVLQSTVNLAEKEQLEVIYGDTDSIMIYTNTNDLAVVKKIGHDFKRAVNKQYNLLEIEMDGFFQRMLLLKKKKYAALAVIEREGRLETTLETKGLDLVRRDWCGLSKDVSGYILDQLFSDTAKEEMLENIHQYLAKVGQDVRAGPGTVIPIDKFIITKSLTKQPDEYADKKSQPHLQVALSMKARGLSARAGDTIPYIICEVEGLEQGAGMAMRARHPDDLAKDQTIKVDVEWYLSTQVHPPVARLIAPIEGTDGARIAECLGLDTRKYISVQGGDGMGGGLGPEEDVYTLGSQLSDEERFKDVQKWKPICRACKEPTEFPGVAIWKPQTASAVEPPSTLFKCSNTACSAPLKVASLAAQLTVEMRAHIVRYANGWLICDEPGCRTRTRNVGVYGERCLIGGCKGSVSLEFPDSALHNQLLYYRHLFDEANVEALIKSKGDREKLGIWNSMLVNDGRQIAELRSVVKRYLDKNARGVVNLQDVFRFCKPPTTHNAAVKFEGSMVLAH